MPLFLDANNRFNRDPAAGSMECPHCRSQAHMAMMASPGFKMLQSKRPGQVGMVFQCDACRMPVFLRYRIKEYLPERVVFHPAAHDVERPAEKFNFSYLPETVASAFRDALGCYRYGLLQAFAAMCRLTADAMFEDLGEKGKLKIFDQLDEIRDIADLDDSMFFTVRQIIFGVDDNRIEVPKVGRGEAAVLLESLKDLLYHAYVREARLRRALKVRRFFADQSQQKVSPLSRTSPRSADAS